MKVHVRSVPTRFSQPTLVSPPCPELPKGDKCIGDPWSLRGPNGEQAGDPAQRYRLLSISLGDGGNKAGKKAKMKPSELQVSINTFVDKLKATLPLPCPFG